MFTMGTFVQSSTSSLANNWYWVSGDDRGPWAELPVVNCTGLTVSKCLSWHEMHVCRVNPNQKFINCNSSNFAKRIKELQMMEEMKQKLSSLAGWQLTLTAGEKCGQETPLSHQLALSRTTRNCILYHLQGQLEPAVDLLTGMTSNHLSVCVRQTCNWAMMDLEAMTGSTASQKEVCENKKKILTSDNSQFAQAINSLPTKFGSRSQLWLMHLI